MNKFQIPQKRVEGYMMPKITFDVIAHNLAEVRFNEWAEELGAAVGRAMDKSLNMDNRLSIKTREKIFGSFVNEIESDKRFKGRVI
jgi:hypothetical protein